MAFGVRRGPWLPQGGSLRRLLLVGWLVPLWGLVVGVSVALGVEQAQRGAAEQDMALRAALAAWPPSVPESPESGHEPPMWLRESRLDGGRVAGSAQLPPLPPGEPRPAAGQVHFYLAEADGRLVRVAAALHDPSSSAAPGQAPAEAVVRQAARPWSERAFHLPNPLRSETLRGVYLLALTMTGVALVLARVASRWLAEAGRALSQPDASAANAASAAGPSELAPAVQHLEALRQSQSRWIEEQRRFLADATHQMRTPMAVLRTQLQSAMAGDVQVDEALQQMLHTVDRASGLANQLLSLSKVEQLKRVGQLPSVGLNAIVREAVMELAPLIAAKRLDFALEGPELSAPGDAALLGELMRNLLANAIHHTPEHGRLGVLLRNATGCTGVLVWDEGPGIDGAVRQRLFQPFSAGKGGVGLGLSICRQIAESMGAEVTLFNRMDQGRVIGVDAVVAWRSAGPQARQGARMPLADGPGH